MIHKNIEKLLNDQIAYEFFSANLYLSMSSFLQGMDLSGFANFFKVQAQEELSHALKQFDYIHQVEGAVKMQAIPQPDAVFQSVVNVFEITLEHEKSVTQKIYAIAKAALDAGDFATHNFIQWFITEQVEEENTVKTILQKIRMIGDSKSALYILDEELGRRVFAPAGGAV